MPIHPPPTVPGASVRVSRRGVILGGALAMAALLASRQARAGGGAPFGGRLSMRVPWPVASIDPHRLDDPAAMLFGACLFDSAYAVGRDGAVEPTLATSLPEPSDDGLRVVLCDGLRFASGRPVTARDLVASVARARIVAGKGWLDPLGAARVAGPTTVVFRGSSPERVARALASPLAAIVPYGYSVERPDGTGPFVARRRGDALVLARNEQAAIAPAFLDEVSVAPAEDLAASLRAFESGEDDIGWLGLGLHEPRRGAVAFDAGGVGWAVLRTGGAAGRWNAPGVAQSLADGIDPSKLAHLGVKGGWTVEPNQGWGGPPCELLVRADSPWLVELGRALAVALSTPSHELRVRTLPTADFAHARTTHAFSLALDICRPYDATPLGVYVALVTSDDPARGAQLAKHPPLGPAAGSPRVVSRLLHLGVVCDVPFQGGRAPDLDMPPGPGGSGVDFGSITRPHPSVP